jgi:hypothetical protein
MSITLGPKLPIMVSAALGDNWLSQGNSMLRALQPLIMANVISLYTTTPPPSPSNGATYIVPAGATGIWSSLATNIAYWSMDNPSSPNGEWEYYVPAKGWIVGCQADGNIYIFNGTTWGIFSPPAGGAPAGTNVFRYPQVNGENGGLANYTLVSKIPAAQVMATGASIQVVVMTGSNLGSNGFIVESASIGATLPCGFPGLFANPTAWTTAPVPITFPAGSFTTVFTRYFSNPVNIIIDTNHDYYIMLYLAGTHTSNVPMFTYPGLTDYIYLGGYVSGNHTADSDSSEVQTPSGSNINGVVQVIIA